LHASPINIGFLSLPARFRDTEIDFVEHLKTSKILDISLFMPVSSLRIRDIPPGRQGGLSYLRLAAMKRQKARWQEEPSAQLGR
jgi:hypothetical protein